MGYFAAEIGLYFETGTTAGRRQVSFLESANGRRKTERKRSSAAPLHGCGRAQSRRRASEA